MNEYTQLLLNIGFFLSVILTASGFIGFITPTIRNPLELLSMIFIGFILLLFNESTRYFLRKPAISRVNSQQNKNVKVSASEGLVNESSDTRFSSSKQATTGSADISSHNLEIKRGSEE